MFGLAPILVVKTSEEVVVKCHMTRNSITFELLSWCFRVPYSVLCLLMWLGTGGRGQVCAGIGAHLEFRLLTNRNCPDLTVISLNGLKLLSGHECATVVFLLKVCTVSVRSSWCTMGLLGKGWHLSFGAEYSNLALMSPKEQGRTGIRME